MSRPAIAQIDVSALKHNISLVRHHAPHSKIVSVVKANAYGHGAAMVAQAIADSTDMMTVSCIEEASVLREVGIQCGILLLEGVFSTEELALAAALDLELVVHEVEQISQLARCDLAFQFAVWLKIDTGMHRLGIQPEQTAECFEQLASFKCVKSVCLMSHFSCADMPESSQTEGQIAELKKQSTRLKQQGHDSVQISMANSAAILQWPQAHFNWVRPGIILYGISPFMFEHQCDGALKPVMTLKSKVIGLRQVQQGKSVGYGATWIAPRHSVIATVAIGYGDGYPRNAKSGTPVLINGKRAKLAGRVSMDLIGVDVSDLQNQVRIGDDVELWGANLNVNEVAKWADTIGYELVTRMPARVPRISVNS